MRNGYNSIWIDDSLGLLKCYLLNSFFFLTSLRAECFKILDCYIYMPGIKILKEMVGGRPGRKRQRKQLVNFPMKVHRRGMAKPWFSKYGCLDQQEQWYSLRTCQECKSSGPTLELLNQKFWSGPEICVQHTLLVTLKYTQV